MKQKFIEFVQEKIMKNISNNTQSTNDLLNQDILNWSEKRNHMNVT